MDVACNVSLPLGTLVSSYERSVAGAQVEGAGRVRVSSVKRHAAVI